MEIHCSLNISTYKPIYAFLRGLRPQLHQRRFVLLLGCLLKGLNNCVNATPLWPHWGRSISSQPSFSARNAEKNRHISNIKTNQHTASLLVRIDLYDANNFSMDDATTISIILHIHVTNTKSLCGTPCFEGRPSDVFTAVWTLKQWIIKIKRAVREILFAQWNWNVSSRHPLHFQLPGLFH